MVSGTEWTKYGGKSLKPDEMAHQSGRDFLPNLPDFQYHPAMIPSILWVAALSIPVSFLLTSCGSFPETSFSGTLSKPLTPRLSPTAKGVRTAPDGSAVAEVNLPPDTVFDITESFLRQNVKVTFANRTNREFEAESGTLLLVVKITALTTGKVGLSATALDHDQHQPDYQAARDLVDDILDALQTSAKTESKSGKIPFKSGSVTPRGD